MLCTCIMISLQHDVQASRNLMIYNNTLTKKTYKISLTSKMKKSLNDIRNDSEDIDATKLCVCRIIASCSHQYNALKG